MTIANLRILQKYFPFTKSNLELGKTKTPQRYKKNLGKFITIIPVQLLLSLN